MSFYPSFYSGHSVFTFVLSPRRGPTTIGLPSTPWRRRLNGLAVTLDTVHLHRAGRSLGTRPARWKFSFKRLGPEKGHQDTLFVTNDRDCRWFLECRRRLPFSYYCHTEIRRRRVCLLPLVRLYTESISPRFLDRVQKKSGGEKRHGKQQSPKTVDGGRDFSVWPPLFSLLVDRDYFLSLSFSLSDDLLTCMLS